MTGAAGAVTVERDKDADPGEIRDAAERGDLGTCQCRAQGSDSGELVRAGDADRDRVEWALDDHGAGPPG
jgi:hypothetical protein